MMRSVVQKHPQARLLLIGDGQDRDALTESIRKNELQSVVSMLGQRSDITQLLHIADLFVFPSLTEGFPLAVLEAMAAAKPMVAFRLPSFRGCVVEGQSGTMVPLGDADAFTRATLELLENPGRMLDMGRAAHDVATRYTQRATSEAIERIYASLVPRSNGHPFVPAAAGATQR